MNLKVWIAESRANFLLLPVMLIILGSGIAHFEGHFHLMHTIFALMGLVMMHITVNVLNEISDYQTGIDFEVTRTPFSGGTGILTSGQIAIPHASLYAKINIALAIIIGIYFVYVVGWHLLPVLVLGLITVVFYTPWLGRVVMGEFAAGLGLGALPIIGAHLVIAQQFSFTAVYVSFIPYLLVFNLLLLNEFPDLETDTRGGRKNLIIVFGKKAAAWIYIAVLLMVYVWMLLGVLMGWIPVWTLLGLLTLPISLNIIRNLFKNLDNLEGFIPLMGQNVMVVLITQLLMGIAFFIA